jgi:hypothetical protein
MLARDGYFRGLDTRARKFDPCKVWPPRDHVEEEAKLFVINILPNLVKASF